MGESVADDMELLVGIILTAVVLLAAQRYGTRALLIPVLLASFGLTVILNSGALGVASLIGLLAAIQIQRGSSYGLTIAAAAAPAALHALYLIGAFGDKASRQNSTNRLLEQVAQLENLGWEVDLHAESLRQLIEWSVVLDPALQFTAALFTAVTGYRLGHEVGRLVRVALPSPLPLRFWRMWDQIIWLLIAALFVRLVSDGFVGDLAANLLFVTLILYAVQGTAVVNYYIRRWNIPLLVEVVFYVGLFFTSFLGILTLAGLGLLETWFDYRRLGVKAESEGDS